MSNIFDVTLDNFQDVILQGSQEKVVAVYFWAASVPDGETLTPLLEQIASEHPHHLILAKIDCETQQQIAMQFGVQAIPTVALFKQGQPVDGFAGNQPDQMVREVFAKHLPQQHEIWLEEAKADIAHGDEAAALAKLTQALELQPNLVEALFLAIQSNLALGRLNEAEALLDSVKLEDKNATYQGLRSQLELKQQAADTPEIRALQERVAHTPDDLEAIQQLGVQLQAAGRTEEALELLFSVLAKNLNALDGTIKKSFMDILAAQPDGDKLVSDYRRKLFTLMY